MNDALWWRVAWRNLWRNRGRTLVTASGLAFGYLAAVVLVGLTDGMSAELIENGTRLLVGQLQIHDPDYLPERSVYNTIGGDAGTDVAALLARVESEPDVASATPRLYGGGLVSAADRTEAGILMGIDPDREGRVSTLLANLDGGRVPRTGRGEVGLGAEMARLLDVGVGDEVVLVAPAADGSMGNDLFTVAGIFRTGTPGIDASYVVLPLPDLQFLMALDPGRIHEIALDVVRPWDTPAISSSLQAALSRAPPAVSVRPWTELRPELAQSVSLMGSVNFVVVLIIFGMAVFGVANTMIIGTFERRREFAVVRALGSSRTSVGRTVVYEGILLGVLALGAGALLTLPVMVWWHNNPPDLSRWVGAFSWSGSQWRPLLRVEYSVSAPIMSAAALFVTAVIAAVVPAWRATRVPPADALADR